MLFRSNKKTGHMAKWDGWVRISMSSSSAPHHQEHRSGSARSRSYQNGYQPAGQRNSTVRTGKGDESTASCGCPARSLAAGTRRGRDNHVVRGYAERDGRPLSACRKCQFAVVSSRRRRADHAPGLRVRSCGCPSDRPFSFPTTLDDGELYDDDRVEAPVTCCGHQEATVAVHPLHAQG